MRQTRRKKDKTKTTSKTTTNTQQHTQQAHEHATDDRQTMILYLWEPYFLTPRPEYVFRVSQPSQGETVNSSECNETQIRFHLALKFRTTLPFLYKPSLSVSYLPAPSNPCSDWLPFSQSKSVSPLTVPNWQLRVTRTAQLTSQAQSVQRLRSASPSPHLPFVWFLSDFPRVCRRELLSVPFRPVCVFHPSTMFAQSMTEEEVNKHGAASELRHFHTTYGQTFGYNERARK